MRGDNNCRIFIQRKMKELNKEIAIIILAAGNGTRMKSNLCKVMHVIAGRTMINHVLQTAKELCAKQVVTVLRDDQDMVAKEVKANIEGAKIAIQKEQLGTGNAVKDALSDLGDVNGAVMIMYGDTPFIEADTIRQMQAKLQDNALCVLGFEPKDAGSYGRLVVQGEHLNEIVEYKDASEQQRAIKLCNSGVIAVRSEYINELVAQIGNNNAKGEYYLTDIVAIANEQGLKCAVVKADEAQVMGINSQSERAVAENIIQEKLRQKFMEEGVVLIAPETVFFSCETKIGQGSVVHPNVVFAGRVEIGENVEIKSFSHIEGAKIDSDSMIGPFARIRPDTNIGKGVKVGNFVEIKKSEIADEAKISHLTYIGDAQIGADVNIGAGTVTCNYDGVNKHKTVIEDGAFIGSNTSLVAPVTIGKGALVGAGSTVLKDVGAGELATNDMKQLNRKK